MSLTSFIDQPEIRRVFRTSIAKQPPLDSNKPMLAPPLTTNYALVGTAFDYLLRFYLERINPGTKTKRWVAGNGILFIEDKQTRELAKKTFEEAQRLYQIYLQDGALSDDLISSSLHLACLDASFRSGGERFNKDGLIYLDERDIEDLKQLMSLVKEQNFKAQRACFLNPTFGYASRMVSGADADIIIDDKIIDIKTTKNLKLEPKYLHQIVGYYILLSLGGIDIKREEICNYIAEISEINDLCIYFSRHGYLHTIKTDDLIAPASLSDFVKWFIKSCCSSEEELLDYCNMFGGNSAKQLKDDISNGSVPV